MAEEVPKPDGDPEPAVDAKLTDSSERSTTTPGKRRIRRLRRTKRQSSSQDLPTGPADTREGSKGSKGSRGSAGESGGTRTDSRPEGTTTRLDASGAARRARVSSAPEAAESDDPLIGSIVDGKYKVLDAIGSGGMATVYKGWHLMLERTVAIKFIHPSATKSVRWGERFFREARIATELTHKNIVATREFGETADGQYYILMDYCAGRPLDELVAKDGPMSPEEATRITVQVLDALAEAHRSSIIHRDVKPSNILVEEGGTARLLDFGLAKAMDSATESDVGTRVGAVLGTPRYMSPEQAEGKTCDHLTDIYSLGVVLYELVSGLLPFEGTSSSDQLRARMVVTPAPPSERVPGLQLPAEFEAIILKAIAVSPGSRWASAEEFKATLEEFLRGEQVDAALPLVAAAFEHRGGLELPGVERVRVHRVRHRELDREGLSWIVQPEAFRRDVLAAFTTQIDLLSRLVHPALAPTVTAGAYEGQRLYAFTGWSEGPTLRDRIGQGAMPNAEVARILRPLLIGMAKAHSFGLSHQAIDSRLIVLSAAGPVLHGVGIVPAARKEPGDPREDVRALATLVLEMYAGAHRDELGEEMIRETGLERATPAVAKVLEHALDEGYPHGGALLRALELADPRYAAGSDRVLHTLNLKRAGVITVLLALLTAAGITVSAWMQPEGTLVVKTEPGATIELDGTVDVAEVHLQGASASDGYGRFSDVPAGDYVVTIKWQDREGKATASVNAHELTTLTVHLSPVAEPPPETPPVEDPPDDPPVEPPPTDDPPVEASPLTPDQRASFNKSVARASGDARALRALAREHLADVTLAESFDAAEQALAKAERVMATGLETREALLARVLAWEDARSKFQAVATEAKAQTPWPRVPTARAAAVTPQVQELANADLQALDSAWEEGRALRGAEGLAAIESTVTAYADLPRLAQGRAELIDLERQISDADSAVDAVRRGSLDDLVHVNHEQAYTDITQRVAALRARSAEASPPLSVLLPQLPAALESVTALLSDWQTLRADMDSLAALAARTNGVMSNISRLSNTVVRVDYPGILALYEDAEVDQYFWKRLVPRMSSVRFRVGPVTYEGDTAFAPVSEFSYVDSVQRKRVHRQNVIVRLRARGGQWKLVSVRQER